MYEILWYLWKMVWIFNWNKSEIHLKSKSTWRTKLINKLLLTMTREELDEAMTSTTMLEWKVSLLTKEWGVLKTIIYPYDEKEAISLKW